MSSNSENVGEVPHASEIDNIKKDVDSLHGAVTSMVDKFDQIKPVCDMISKEKMDKNKDGVISPKEFISWGAEMLNGEGFKMLLITLFSIIFDYIYNYLLAALSFGSDNVLSLIGKLIAFSIVTYGYKTVLTKVDRGKSKLVRVINMRDEEIEVLRHEKQASRLAIELLRHDNTFLTERINELKKEKEEWKKEREKLLKSR